MCQYEVGLYTCEEMFYFDPYGRDDLIVSLLLLRQFFHPGLLHGHQYRASRIVFRHSGESEVSPYGESRERFHEAACFQQGIVMARSRLGLSDRQDETLRRDDHVFLGMLLLFSRVVLALVLRGDAPLDGPFGPVYEYVTNFRMFPKDSCQASSVGRRNHTVFFNALPSGGRRMSIHAYALDLGRSKAHHRVA